MSTPSSKIIAKTRYILETVQESHYQHITHVDEATGVYDVDCSGLLCYILREMLPGHLDAVPPAPDHNRPLTLQFYETFTAATDLPEGSDGWQHITRIADARPGDVICWRLPQQVAGKDTGHVMIVDESPVLDGDDIYRVVVIDSADAPHADDTRPAGTTGVGSGTMWFVTDDQRDLIGYHWRLRDGELHEMAIAIGRAVESD
jgi:hypothetical protein